MANQSKLVPNTSMLQSPLNQQLQSRVAILWDMENCPIPSGVPPEDVAGNIRMALQGHPQTQGAIVMFSAYGDFNAFPRRLREGCQRTGVKLIDVPNGRKDATDKAILVDMMLFASDNPPPFCIMLISGDVDFAQALHMLGQRGYTVILVIPDGVGVAPALLNAGKFVGYWSSVARGQGIVPHFKALMPSRGGSIEIAGYLMGCHINDNSDGQNEEKAMWMSQGYYYNSRDFSMVPQFLSESNCGTSNMTCLPTTVRSHALLSGLNDASGGPMPSSDHNKCQLWGPTPGDLNSLKGQLVRLLELSGGCLPLARVPAEYQKMYGRTLHASNYGATKLASLFKKMGDPMGVEGKGHRNVYLKDWQAGPSAAPLALAKKDEKGKLVLEEKEGPSAPPLVLEEKAGPSAAPLALAKKDNKGKLVLEEKAGPSAPPLALAKKDKKGKGAWK